MSPLSYNWTRISVSLAAYFVGSPWWKVSSSISFAVAHHCTYRTSSFVVAAHKPVFGSSSTHENIKRKRTIMSSSSSSSYSWNDKKDESLKKCIVPLSEDSHKGSSGRVGILGGSARYTGAPYYAAMASLKVGSDLSYIFCAEEAALPIKSYSPELMVQPVYSGKEFDQAVDESRENSQETQSLVDKMVEHVVDMIPRMHALVIGPGLGRCPLVFKATSRIIQAAKQHNLSLVMDADSLFMLACEEYNTLLGDYSNVVLTPNMVEYKRLLEAQEGLEQPIIPENAIVVKKGKEDEVSTDAGRTLLCAEQGGLKRSGGIGDILAGTLGTFCAWKTILSEQKDQEIDHVLSCWSACCVVKHATKRAFDHRRRAMTAPDVLDEIGAAFDEMTS